MWHNGKQTAPAGPVGYYCDCRPFAVGFTARGWQPARLILCGSAGCGRGFAELLQLLKAKSRLSASKAPRYLKLAMFLGDKWGRILCIYG